MVQYFPIVTGSLIVSGSITATGGITMSGSIASASFAANAATASFVTLAQTASFVTTAQTASFVTTAQTASFVALAQTASSADNFLVRNTLTAQTLVVQTITSSVDFITGSSRFGTLLSNTHVFSGSVTMNPNGLFVSSSGVVGIGTTDPSLATLQISGSDTGFRIQGASRAQMVLQTASGSWQIESPYGTSNVQSGSLGIIEAGVGVRLTIQRNTGYIGIGTTNPGYRLDVNGDTQLRGDLIFNKGSRSTIYPATSGENLHIKANGGGALQLMDDAAGNIQMVNGGGNVGIGTTGPSARLDIQRTTSTDNLRFIGAAASDYSDMVFYATNNTTRLGYIDWSNTQSRYNVEANIPLVLYTSGSERMRITSAGDIEFKGGAVRANGGYFRLSNSAGTTAYGYFIPKALWLGSGTDQSPSMAGEGGYGLSFFTNGTIAERMTITTSGSVGIGTTNIGTEANLYLGPQGASEGGQITLQSATSYVSASHLDNYQNRFRVMSGNNTTSAAERFSVDMTNGNLTAYGSSYLGTNIILSNSTGATSGQSVTGVSGEYGSSSWTVNLATLFSNYTFTSRALSVFLQILGVSDGSNGSSILVHAYKSIGGTWVINTVNTATNGSTFLNSVTASSNTITINWNTTAFGCVNVTMINRQ